MRGEKKKGQKSKLKNHFSRKPQNLFLYGYFWRKRERLMRLIHVHISFNIIKKTMSI